MKKTFILFCTILITSAILGAQIKTPTLHRYPSNEKIIDSLELQLEHSSLNQSIEISLELIPLLSKSLKRDVFEKHYAIMQQKLTKDSVHDNTIQLSILQYELAKLYGKFRHDYFLDTLYTQINNIEIPKIKSYLLVEKIKILGSSLRFRECLDLIANEIDFKTQNYHNQIVVRYWQIVSLSELNLHDEMKKQIPKLKELSSHKGILLHDKVYLYTILGIIYSEIFEIENSNFYQKKALELSKSENDFTSASYAAQNIAKNYSNISDHNGAIQFLHDALFLAHNARMPIRLNRFYYALANNYNIVQVQDSSVKYAKLALESSIERNDTIMILTTLSTLLSQTKNDQQPEKMKNLINQFRKYKGAFSRAKKDPRLNAKLESSMINYYIDLKDYDEAEKLLLDGIEHSIYEDKINKMRILADIYLKKNNLQEAINYYKKIIPYQDTTHKVKEESILNGYKVEYETEKVKKENEFLELQAINDKQNLKIRNQQVRSKNIIIFCSLFLLALLVAFVFYLQKLNAEKKRLLNDLSLKNNHIEKIYQKLKRSNKIKDKFISIISHDYKRPLISISNRITQLKIKGQLVDPIIETELGKTFALIDNFIYWAMYEINNLSGIAEYDHIGNIIKKSVQELDLKLNEKNISISIQEDNFVTFGQLPEQALLFIFRNLLSNAINHSKRDGKIELKVDSAGEMMNCVIEDFGTGIENEKLQNLFKNPLPTQTSDSNNGFGIGLRLVYDVINELGGTIRILSQKEKGTKVHFTLPKTITRKIDNLEIA